MCTCRLCATTPAHMRFYMHAYIHTCIHTYIHTYTHTHTQRHVCIYIYTYECLPLNPEPCPSFERRNPKHAQRHHRQRICFWCTDSSRFLKKPKHRPLDRGGCSHPLHPTKSKTTLMQTCFKEWATIVGHSVMKPFRALCLQMGRLAPATRPALCSCANLLARMCMHAWMDMYVWM